MAKSIVAGMLRAVSLAALVSISWTEPARAEIVYNYAQRWLFDSVTGRYWQIAQIPNETFVPSFGTIANSFDLDELDTNAGISGTYPYFSLIAPYSPELATYLSFFAFNRPAIAGELISFQAVYHAPLVGSPTAGQYEFMNYRYVPEPQPDPLPDPELEPFTPYWIYTRVSTIGAYGPMNPCPTQCEPTQLAFVYSEVQPVPLPASLFLMLSALGLLRAGLFRPIR